MPTKLISGFTRFWDYSWEAFLLQTCLIIYSVCSVCVGRFSRLRIGPFKNSNLPKIIFLPGFFLFTAEFRVYYQSGIGLL